MIGVYQAQLEMQFHPLKDLILQEFFLKLCGQ